MPKEKSKTNLTQENTGTSKLTVQECKDTMDRLEAKLSRNTRGCLEVNLASKTDAGYKDVHVSGHKQKFLFHHVSWVSATGQKIPLNRQWIHRCHNPGCGEPSHGYWGTRDQNEQSKLCSLVEVEGKIILVCSCDPECMPTKTLKGRYIQ